MDIRLDALPSDPTALHAIIHAQAAALRSRDTLIDRLRAQLAGAEARPVRHLVREARAGDRAAGAHARGRRGDAGGGGADRPVPRAGGDPEPSRAPDTAAAPAARGGAPRARAGLSRLRRQL